MSTRCLLLLSAAALLPAHAPALSVSGGLTPYQVVQCDAAGAGVLALRGEAGGAGRIEGRVNAEAGEVKPWSALAETAGGAWEGRIEAAPAGGPYTVELRLVDAGGAVIETASVAPVLVGDLWVLAGQSNMQGVGNRVDVEAPDPRVHALRMNRQWQPAEEPLHVLQESPDPVHFNPKDEAERAAGIQQAYAWSKGAGLGLPFAKEMVARTGRPVGLVVTAHGGTSMDQWDPAGRDQGGNSLYGSMYASVQAAGGAVRGVLWYQGESDATPEAAPQFTTKFANLIAAMRADFGGPEMPFYFVQIGRVVTDLDAASWSLIRQAQLDIESSVPRTGAVPAIDLALDDLIHIGTPGLKTLGKRLAQRAHRDLFGGSGLPGPRLAAVERAETPYGHTLRVRFAGVNGGLRAAGRLAGFTVTAGPAGPGDNFVFKEEIAADAPDTVVLWLREWPESPHLWYGRGLDPYCNLTDADEMGVPAFGPLPVPAAAAP